MGWYYYVIIIIINNPTDKTIIWFKLTRNSDLDYN